MSDTPAAPARFIIIGAGAVGATIGGCLFQAGHDVVLVARGAHLDALRADGLRLVTPMGTQQLRIPAVAGPAELELRGDDVLILSTKGQDTVGVLEQWAWEPVHGAVEAAAGLLPVVCAQNGVANEGIALRRFRHVYGMCVWLPATHLEPGVVEAQGIPRAGLLPVGRYPAGTDDFTQQLSATLEASRLLAPASEDVMRWKYGKLLGNLGNAVEALCGPAAADDDARELRRRARAEGTEVLRAAGIGHALPGEFDAARGGQVNVGDVDGAARSGGSSWQSLSRRTGTIEADFLNGEIALLGRIHGMPTPVNETLQRLANQVARAHEPPGGIVPADILAAAASGWSLRGALGPEEGPGLLRPEKHDRAQSDQPDDALQDCRRGGRRSVVPHIGRPDEHSHGVDAEEHSSRGPRPAPAVQTRAGNEDPQANTDHAKDPGQRQSVCCSAPGQDRMGHQGGAPPGVHRGASRH
jgi:2-dehydropantoate 2-reductase